MTTLTDRAGPEKYEAERYVHARDVCITAWRRVLLREADSVLGTTT